MLHRLFAATGVRHRRVNVGDPVIQMIRCRRRVPLISSFRYALSRIVAGEFHNCMFNVTEIWAVCAQRSGSGGRRDNSQKFAIIVSGRQPQCGFFFILAILYEENRKIARITNK